MQGKLNIVDFDIMEKLFAAKCFVPNDSQREAIFCVDRPLFLTAGPGSGKTRVILWRTVNLIVFHNVKPAEIFLATFTEKAALQLKQGLQCLLSIASTFTGKPYDLAEMYVGTLHSLCLKLLSDRRFNKEKARVRRPMVLDDLQQYQFIYNFHLKEIIDASGINYGDDITKAYIQINQWFDIKSKSKNQTTANLISFFNRMNEEDFSDDKLMLAGADDTLNALFKMTIKYRELMNTNGVERVDFSSLQKKAYNYISNFSEAGSVFKHIIVDEYQDTNTIQQKIYMKLAEGTKHICVVGDDDQALYRFRGATVENLVDFETICKVMIGEKPKRIDLNINYRSRAHIVNTYKDFIETCDWSDPEDDSVFYRIQNKNIEANSDDDGPAVILQKGKKEVVAEKVVDFVIDLKEKGKITDFNQCAILFPSLRYNNEMNSSVEALAKAFSNKGIPYYAPRAKNFLNTKECLVTFGLFARIFGYKTKIKEQKYTKWFEDADAEANELIEKDAHLARFIATRQKQIAFAKKNYAVLIKYCNNHNIDVNSSADLSLISKLSLIQNLDEEVKKGLGRGQLKQFVYYRSKINNPVNVSYVLARVTALDWTVLDLFYQLNCFDYFSSMYESAEKGREDAGMYNLGMITSLISRFMETFGPILSGFCFQTNNDVATSMFDSFLYMIYRRGETEYEDSEDPFPKGCVPFITIHQSKGLEFPVVILGSISHTKHKARELDVLVRDIQNANGETPRICEPLELMDTYDAMRMFYVAISRAKNLVVLCCPDRTRVFENFKEYLANINLPDIDGFDMDSLPEVKVDNEQLAHVYSYTADFIPYEQCPRNYMVFHKYGFVPSRNPTMFLGSLVHQTIEDLQNYLRAGELHMDENAYLDLTEAKIKQFFEENFNSLRESAGHTISRCLKEKALHQILCYWRKNKEIILKMTRSEVKLSLPEQKTPNHKIPYTIEGVVDIVQEGCETWLYDLKTHPIDRIIGQPQSYKDQLNIYGFIWQNLQGNELDNTAIISTPIPENLQRAIKNKDEIAIERLMENWDPVIPFGYSEDEVADIIEKFGITVEKIENSEFNAPPVEVLNSKVEGMKSSFGTSVCRNCDVKFSCNSYVSFVTSSRGANRQNMIEYMKISDSEQNDFIDDNLDESIKEDLYYGKA